MHHRGLRASPLAFGLFKNRQPKAIVKEENTTEEMQDAQEANELINAASDSVEVNRWAPILELPVESFTKGEEQLEVGKMVLNPNLFKVEIRRDILHRVVIWQLARRRQGTHKTKSRAEVRGGGRKPRPQKGTGRSRQGSIRSPLWRGGGHAHPKRPRDYSYPLLTKVKRLGLKMALSLKYAQGKLKLVKNTEIEQPKTKLLVSKLKTKGWHGKKTLLIDGKYVNEWFRRASNNLPLLKVLPQRACNVYDILSYDQLVLTLEAVQYLEQRLVDPNEPQFYEFVSKNDQLINTPTPLPPVERKRLLEQQQQQEETQHELQNAAQ